ncbi:hypothetical protein GEV33_003178 [Tenebrio molitor]|uniref:Uncharacterized protein n=1 Tax=Tenebrio molitor TaxID=7067 RepID=A0A8J6HSV5_TENMO|nr:hypothetical protein GEV33_003178 [Tenebrio molitor]
MFRSHRYILIRIGSRAPLVSLIIASPLTAVLDLSPAFDQLNLEIDIGIGSAFLLTWGFSHVTRSTVNLISTVFCGLSEFAPEIRFASALFEPFGASWLRIDVHLYSEARPYTYAVKHSFTSEVLNWLHASILSDSPRKACDKIISFLDSPNEDLFSTITLNVLVLELRGTRMDAKTSVRSKLVRPQRGHKSDSSGHWSFRGCGECSEAIWMLGVGQGGVLWPTLFSLVSKTGTERKQIVCKWLSCPATLQPVAAGAWGHKSTRPRTATPTSKTIQCQSVTTLEIGFVGICDNMLACSQFHYEHLVRGDVVTVHVNSGRLARRIEQHYLQRYYGNGVLRQPIRQRSNCIICNSVAVHSVSYACTCRDIECRSSPRGYICTIVPYGLRIAP